jgi:general secretion pathway protein G
MRRAGGDVISVPSRSDGFTLIELLIVIVLLGLLAGITVFAVGGITERGKTSTCEADRRVVEAAIEIYKSSSSSTAQVTEADLVAAGFLRSESANWNIVAGAVVPDPSGPLNCDP